jgi:hypothetical protein
MELDAALGYKEYALERGIIIVFGKYLRKGVKREENNVRIEQGRE